MQDLNRVSARVLATAALVFALGLGLTSTAQAQQTGDCSSSCAASISDPPGQILTGDALNFQFFANNRSQQQPIDAMGFVASQLSCSAVANSAGVGASGTCCARLACVTGVNCVQPFLAPFALPGTFTGTSCSTSAPGLSCNVIDDNTVCLSGSTILPAEALVELLSVDTTATNPVANDLDMGGTVGDFSAALNTLNNYLVDVTVDAACTEDTGLSDNGSCQTTEAGSYPPVCAVELDKQISCDGGNTFVDVGFGDNATQSCDGWNAFDGQPGETIIVRYVARPTPNADLDLNSCVITESNGGIGDPPAPGLIGLGGQFSFDDVDQICSDTLAGGEPDTATINCSCDTAEPTIDLAASDSDMANFECLDPSLTVSKLCVDTDADLADDRASIDVSNNGTADLVGCVLTDTLDTNEPTPACPGDGIGLEQTVIPLGDLPAGQGFPTQNIDFGDRLTDSCNTASVTCTVDGTNKTVTIDDAAACRAIVICPVTLDCSGFNTDCGIASCDPAGAQDNCDILTPVPAIVCRPGSGDLCDPDEICDGVNTGACPADVVAPPTTICNPGSGDICDPAESCTGTPLAVCPPDNIAPATTICRPGSGDVCDPDESCTGIADVACPADVVTPATTICNPGSGDICDPAESCTGTPLAVCPPDTVAPATTICRPGSGDVCDPDESCTGIADVVCPADVVAPATTICNPGSGDICDPAESCTGTPLDACPPDTIAPATTICRPGSGDVCDPDESCTGNPDVACPADLVAPATTICNPGSGDICDPAESCTGTPLDACPGDTIAPATTICRPGSGDVCDPDESCTGIADVACPADVVTPATTICNPGSGDICDPAESCTGTPLDACPPDTVAPATTICRPGSGDVCDPDESCTGNPDVACPADLVAPATTICNPGSGDICDPAESCTGTPLDACPPDTIAPATTICRPGSGDVCDPDESCTGNPDVACPADLVAPATTICNPGSGDICDPAESCTGTPLDACPPDTVAPATTICRPGSGDVCDPDESCTGIADVACPADVVTPATTICNPGSGDICDPAESCTGTPLDACPGDNIAPATTICRPGSGDVCDPDESCTGIADAACPTDVVAPATTICNPGSGDICDPDESCTGTPLDACPADVITPATTICNPGSGDICDPDESCTGVADAACPTDVISPATTVCNPGSGDICDPDESCTGIADVACPADFVTPPTTICRPGDACSPPESCTGVPDATCPPDVVGPGTTTGVTVDTNAMGNSLAIPFITRRDVDLPLRYTATVVNITNSKDVQFGVPGPVYLHFEVISGDDGDPAGHSHTTVNDWWTSQDTVCITTPGETTQITFEPHPDGERSIMMFECSHQAAAPGIPGDHGANTDPLGKSFMQSVTVNAKSGILWVTQETFPNSGVYLEGDILEGRAHVLEFGNGSAYTLDAIPFEGLDNFDGADHKWLFDGKEFPNAPLNWMTSVILPDEAGLVQAQLLLFSLDGNLSNWGVGGPNPKFEYVWYDDDENRQKSDHYEFDCFEWIDLDVDLEVTAAIAGTPTGHIRLKHVVQTQINDAVHDANHKGPISDNQRVYPFYGYLVYHFETQAPIQKACIDPANAGLGAGGPIAPNNVDCTIGQTITFANPAATAHLLTKGLNATVPVCPDCPTLVRD